MNIYQSINAVMEDLGPIAKDSKNDKQNYKFRGIDAVMNALSPALTKHKIFVAPEVISVTREAKTSSNGSTLQYSILTVKYTFYAEDGSSVSATVVGEGMDSGDKASNKAMSTAFKYACFQVFCIPTEEMRDSEEDSHKVIAEDSPIIDFVKKINEVQKVELLKEAKRTGYTENSILKKLNVEKMEDIDIDAFNWLMDNFKKMPTKGDK